MFRLFGAKTSILEKFKGKIKILIIHNLFCQKFATVWQNSLLTHEAAAELYNSSVSITSNDPGPNSHRKPFV